MKIAIRGHESRGKEVIQVLESLGGNNLYIMTGSTPDCAYYVTSCYNIDGNPIKYVREAGYIVYTLEEFEKEFPFKIGDEVIFPVKVGWLSGKVTGLTYVEDQLKYEVNTRIDRYHYVEPHKLQLYPMKEERNIKLTLDKAKEWYQKGGELKEVALQAFTEDELTKVDLPKTWKEFCENYPKCPGEAYINQTSNIFKYDSKNFRQINVDKNICPSKRSAEAHLAMIQLEQLRNCWLNGWEPNWNDEKQNKYCIVYYKGEFKINILCETRRFLSFPTYKMAKEFLECFRDLIEKAGDLI